MAPESATTDWTDLERSVRADLETGDADAAATRAIEKLTPVVLSYLHLMLDEEDAQDALSIFRETLWKALPRFRWECSLRAWAYRLAHHAATRLLRRPHRRREEHLPSSAASRLPASLGVGASGRHAGLAVLRASLPVNDRELLTLRVERELEWEEIAVVLDGENSAADDEADPPMAEAARRNRSAALRKRYERLTRRLEQMAREQGLID